MVLDVTCTNACEYIVEPDNKSMQQQINQEDEGYSVSLFPNPTNGTLNIQILSENEGLCIFEIYDLVGKRIKTSLILINESETIDVSSLEQGVYYCIITYMDKTILNDKLVIIK